MENDNELEQDKKVLNFSFLMRGDKLLIVLGKGDMQSRFKFIVEENGYWPKGRLYPVLPDDSLATPRTVFLKGSGSWVAQQPAPGQTESKRFTAYDLGLVIDEFLIIEPADNGGEVNVVFDKPGQEISELKPLL